MKRVVGLLGIMGLLGGCATSGGESPSWLIERAQTAPRACAPLTSEQELAINLAQEMADAGRLHAALANLERLPSTLPEARLRKARALRALGRSEAKGLYESLLGTCLTAEGRHGLGQLAAADKHYDEALEHLRKAVSLMPTDDAMRNDLGVVYLNLRRLEESRFELLTALELNPEEKRPALNLVTLLIYQGSWQQASALVTRMGFTPEQFRQADARARVLKGEDTNRLQSTTAAATRKETPAPVPSPAASPAGAGVPAVIPAPVPASAGKPKVVIPATPVIRPTPAPASASAPIAPVQRWTPPAQPAPAVVAPVNPAVSQGVQQVPNARSTAPLGGGVQRVAPAAGGRGEAIVPISGVERP